MGRWKKQTVPAARGPRRVLILRPDNLGDAVLFSGALRHIAASYPQARLAMCVKRCVRDYFELCPFVDALLCWEDVRDGLMSGPRLSWSVSIPGGTRPARWLRALARRYARFRLRADMLLLPVRSPGGGRRGMHQFVRACAARVRYGIAGDFSNQSPDSDRAAEAFYTRRMRLTAERRRDHELLVTRDFLQLIGVEVTTEDLWPQVWTDRQDRRWAEQCVPREDAAVTVAVCPGVTSVLGKAYPAAAYARTFEALGDKRFSLVLFGSPPERPACEEVARAVAGCGNVAAVKNLAGQSTIRQLVEGLRRCDAVLAQETAALHIAVALRKPTVGIVGGGHYGRFYPWGDPAINRVAHQPMDCYHCNWRCVHPTIRCIQEIPPEVIAAELDRALGAFEPWKIASVSAASTA